MYALTDLQSSCLDHFSPPTSTGVTCRRFQDLSVTFCLSLIEGLLWLPRKIAWFAYIVRSTRISGPGVICNLIESHLRLSPSYPGWFCSLMPLSKMKWLSSLPCLTILLPHYTSWDHLPTNYLHQNPDLRICFSGKVSEYTSLFLHAILQMLWFQNCLRFECSDPALFYLQVLLSFQGMSLQNIRFFKNTYIVLWHNHLCLATYLAFISWSVNIWWINEQMRVAESEF